MYLAATSSRRTALTEKVYARAAEIERLKKELKAEQKRAAVEALAGPEPIKPNEVVSSFRKRTVREILKISSDYFGLPQEIIIGPSKPKDVITARQVAMYVSYYYGGASLPQVGVIFNRDHTTVLYAVRKVQHLLDRGDMDIRNHVDRIRMKLQTFDLNEMPYWGC